MTSLGSCADNDNKQTGRCRRLVAVHDHKMEKLPTGNPLIGTGGVGAAEETKNDALYYRRHLIFVPRARLRVRDLHPRRRGLFARHCIVLCLGFFHGRLPIYHLRPTTISSTDACDKTLVMPPCSYIPEGHYMPHLYTTHYTSTTSF